LKCSESETEAFFKGEPGSDNHPIRIAQTISATAITPKLDTRIRLMCTRIAGVH
jgi:hypothetical protein